MEERLRDRNTGFVCFMSRADAEDAMEACSEADPFNVGRRLMMRWGKHVKKSAGGAPIVKKGTGGIVDTAPMSALHKKSDLENHRAAAALEASLNVDHRSSIRVVPPQDKRRAHFISTVASFVAKDGQQFESTLIQREFQNPAFSFLTFTSSASEVQKQEHIFYKWRVYSFCQGDGFHTWRVEPFCMFAQHGCTWIPPPIDVEAARREEEEIKRKQEEIERQKQQRRFQSSKRGFMTGRQLEQARRGGPDGGAKLTREELRDFDRLFREQLCASRESICQAMAFCFEKSSAAKHISDLLRGLFLDITPGTSVDTLIARLFLISDILFNSQQPGIRNAFLYRGAIENMSPEAFKSLGAYSRETFRFTGRKRITSAIAAVLGAWANWGVYDPIFLDELQSRFEGKEIVAPKREKQYREDDTDVPAEDAEKTTLAKDGSAEEALVSEKRRGDWTTVPAHSEKTDGVSTTASAVNAAVQENPDGEPLDEDQSQDDEDVDGELLDDEDPDGEPLDADADGEPLDDDADGEPLDEEDPDGAPLDNDEDPHGTPLVDSEDPSGIAVTEGPDDAEI